MRSELSAWNYIRNNKKTTGTLVVALTMVFVAMYLTSMLLLTTTESVETFMKETPKKLSYLSISFGAYGLRADDYASNEELLLAYDEKTNELAEKLKTVPGIDNAYYTQIIQYVYQSVVGQTGVTVPLMDAADIPGFLTHMEAELIEGKMPTGDGEILADKNIMKNGEYSIDDYFMEKGYGETFKICGVIESPYMISVGTPRGYTNNGWYIVVEKDESITDMTEILKGLGIEVSDRDTVNDSIAYEEMFKKDVEDVLVGVLDVVYLVVMLFLAFTVLIAYVSYMRNRVNEYCLYMSIGYSRSAVYRMIMREMLILFGFGALAGFGMSVLGGFMMHSLLIEAKGLSCRLIMPEQIFYILASFVGIMGILQIPIVYSINAVKTIDAIED